MIERFDDAGLTVAENVVDVLLALPAAETEPDTDPQTLAGTLIVIDFVEVWSHARLPALQVTLVPLREQPDDET